MRLALALALLIAGCGSGASCEDPDGDGYGPGCELGDDCDVNNAARNRDCETVPPPDCRAEPGATGCPCLPNTVSACLDERAGIGQCVQGRSSCTAGFWGLCEGSVGPSSERCDGVDQDCDGLVDEGVLSPCGGCNDACRGGVWGPGPEPFEATDALEVTERGDLTLALVEQRFGQLWVPNTADGTVSAIDADAAVETARYPSLGSEPTRVAVDFLGDAWVLNREFDGIPTATKIASSPERCVDRDGEGLETSTGPNDVRVDDECVLLHVPVGEVGSVARAVAIDGDTGLDGASGGDPWVGLHDAEAVVEIDGVTGALKTRIETPGFSPYAATFDRWGTLWMIDRDGLLARIDVRADPPTHEILEVPYACYLLYGLAADERGRLLLSGFSCDRIFSYEPDLAIWSTRSAPASPRAVAFADGAFWFAHTTGSVTQATLAPLSVAQTLSALGGLEPVETIGVGIDGSGRVWTIASRSQSGELGVVTRVDPELGAVDAQLQVGTGPHVQGDPTGSRVRYTLTPEGSATHVMEGCGAGVATRWIAAHATGSAGSAGEIEVELRHAASADGLAAVPFERLGTLPDDTPPWPLDLPEGGAVELRVTLRVLGRTGGPRLSSVGLEWACPGPD